MHRRTVLKIGAGLGVTGGLGVAVGYRLLPPAPSPELQPVDRLARELLASLDDEQRADACVPYDHPLRQYHNRGVWGGGRDIMFGFSRRQRRLLTDLMHAGLSAEGRQRVPEEYFAQWTGVHSMRALVCGDPATGPYQVILTGAHINLRLGGASREGAAFGGPQVYGDQRGDSRPGLPGNLYRDQFELGHRLFRSLTPAQRTRAVLEVEPMQTSIELQGPSGTFPGVPVAELDNEHRLVAVQLVDRILSTYSAADADHARQCLAANGGIAALCLSYYERGSGGRISEAQVFRLEGPAAVFHFRGYPHVHAFVNVAMSADAPLSSGEPLGENSRWLDNAGVKALFEAAMRSESGADLAYYPEDRVAGRLRPGAIRSGDIYALESWQETMDLVEVHGSNLTPLMLDQLGSTPDGSRMYRIATSEYAARELQERLGRVESRQQTRLMRDVAIAYLKQHGFEATDRKTV
jgi:hypothetical protein